jgi:hypothetical protein
VGIYTKIRRKLIRKAFKLKSTSSTKKDRIVNAWNQMKNHLDVRLRILLFDLLKDKLERKRVITSYEDTKIKR